jgi:hypothetical protein
VLRFSAEKAGDAWTCEFSRTGGYQIPGDIEHDEGDVLFARFWRQEPTIRPLSPSSVKPCRAGSLIGEAVQKSALRLTWRL